ncbi:MAG: heavy metal-responsive transcriptional regulator [Actinomycetota bacterium]
MLIGELGRRTGVSTKTIRYYESLGLLEPARRSPSGYRQYDDEDVDRLRFVREAQGTGLSLAEIASVLELKGAGERSCSHTLALVERHVADIDAQIEQLHRSRAQLAQLAERARGLDPATCTDPNRCQVITADSDAGDTGTVTGG